MRRWWQPARSGWFEDEHVIAVLHGRGATRFNCITSTGMSGDKRVPVSHPTLAGNFAAPPMPTPKRDFLRSSDPLKLEPGGICPVCPPWPGIV